MLSVALLTVTLCLKLPDLRKKKGVVPRLSHNIDVSMRSITYSETRDGVRKWVLDAQQADVAQKDGRIYLTKPRFIVYLQRQPGTVTLTSGRAVYDIKNHNVTLSDTVVATGDGGMRIESEKVFYHAGRSLLISDDHVRIFHRSAAVEGDGMEFQTVNGTVRLLRNVTATLKAGGR